MRLREAVLGAIREEQGQWVSGERLSMSLKVSRTTIWKQIKILQSEGYAIESSPKKGYRLSMIPDILSPEEVKDGLQTQLFGREHYYYFKEIDSTNNYAKPGADGPRRGRVILKVRAPDEDGEEGNGTRIRGRASFYR